MQVQGLSKDRAAHESAGPKHVVIAALVLGLSACSTWSAQSPAGAQAAEVQSAPLAATTSKFTAVGQKAAQLRADFEKLKANT
jgi:curli biogenesis system outer membrane secretion channel CsgG